MLFSQPEEGEKQTLTLSETKESSPMSISLENICVDPLQLNIYLSRDALDHDCDQTDW